MARFNLQFTTGDDVPERTEAEFQFVSRQLRRAETVALAAPMFVPLIEFVAGTLRGWFGDKLDESHRDGFEQGASVGREFRASAAAPEPTDEAGGD